MNETLGAAGVAQILDFTMYPWGNAYYNTTQCGTDVYDKPSGMYCWIKQCNVPKPAPDCFRGFVWCQHGDDECTENRVEGCVIKYFPKPALYSVFMSCYENDNSFETCAAQAGINAATSKLIQSCAAPSSAIGNNVEVENAQATVALGNSKLGTPWVIVNGKYLDNPDNLLETVCQEYTGRQPAGCR